MRNRLALWCCAGVVIAANAAAQAPVSAPLNVIDWLDAQPTPSTPVALPAPSEPAVADSARVPSVTVAPLDGEAPKRVGLAPATVTGLPDTLWSGTDGRALAQQVRDMPELRVPALQSLFYTLLLAEALPPADNAADFDLARVTALADVGALEPALALMEQANPTQNAAHFARYMDLSLLTGTENAACATLRAMPALSPGKAHEVFCAARAGDWDTAVLQLGTSRVLGLIDETQASALERFLDPELYEGEAALPVPSRPDALLFRLYQAIGTPVPTRVWPVVYANADLADTAGWKARIEAAERLARHGALPENRLLGILTHRQPAASGGVWDRVSAVQRFETALRTGSPTAISKTLPTAWRHMRKARLAVPFASLFAEDLSKIVLSGPSADIAFDMLLVSASYESAAQVFPARALRHPLATAVAAGSAPADTTPLIGTAQAIGAAFADAPPDASLIAMAQDGALGDALLRTIALTQLGGAGDVAQLTTGLATLRALGLEDVARRTALQVLLLEDTQ
ncbi:hypothetical protein [uncultured Tateyamaria sp.]|uniref:hypothetical protein n=1 Tax=uncultured Tateyamaria sp. TaxID=455651 RepID=UPI0026048522|nr:hypothetical protein [uncultured Tateyamaria sp.]